MNRIFLLIIIASIIAAGGWFILQEKGDSLPFVKIGETNIEIEIADTPEKRAQGLSNRDILLENNGMLFIFNEPGLYSFWMKDMRFPIDIIWLSEDYKIIGIAKNISPDSFPKTFKPQKPAQYVLEVNAGFVEKNNISIGSSVDNLNLQ